MPTTRIEVEREDAGERLDRVLVRRLGSLSRDRARVLFAAGRVLVDGRVAKKSHLVAEGEHVTIEGALEPVSFHAKADPEAAFRIVEEHRDFVIVDKPVGMPSHPLRPDEVGTVASGLVARYPEMRGVGYGPREPGIVHRLDNDTAGLLIAARHASAFDALVEMLRAGNIEKQYEATCLGTVPAPMRIDWPIANDPRDPRKVRVCRVSREATRLRAWPALTEVLESEPVPGGSHVRLRANHARRHQIRVHLSALGHPLLGDVTYGAPPHASGHHHLRATRIRFVLEGREFDVTV